MLKFSSSSKLCLFRLKKTCHGLYSIRPVSLTTGHTLKDSAIKFLYISAAIFTKFCGNICQILRQFFSTQTSKIYKNSYISRNSVKLSNNIV